MFILHPFTSLNNAYSLNCLCIFYTVSSPAVCSPLKEEYHCGFGWFTIWPQALSSSTPSDNACQGNNVSCVTLTKAACCVEIMKHWAAAQRAKGAITLVEGLQASSLRNDIAPAWQCFFILLLKQAQWLKKTTECKVDTAVHQCAPHPDCHYRQAIMTPETTIV